MIQFACRLLQLAGMALLPVAIVMQARNRITEGQMLTIAVFGAALFWLGHWIQRVQKPS